MPRPRKPRPSTATFAGQGDPYQCAARAKSTGLRCKAGVVPGKAVCIKHGGRAGPPLKTGKFSSGAGRIGEAYQRWVQQIDALDPTDHLAAMAALAERCMQRVEEKDTPEFRRNAIALYEEALSQDAQTSPERRAAALTALGKLLRKGASEDTALRGAMDGMERLGKRLEAERALRNQEAHTVRMADLQGMVMGILTVLLEHGNVGRQIATEIEARVIRPSGMLQLAGIEHEKGGAAEGAV